jgi:signal peptidase I
MNINVPLILVILALITGIIWLFDAIFFARQRKVAHKKMPVIVDYARSFFPIILIVLCIRSFIVNPFRVPSGSLEPTILVNEFIAVNQFTYGIRLPVLNTKIIKIGEPKVGDIVVFRYPANPSINFIKRVIGTPGDHVVYMNKTLYINGKKIPRHFIKNTIDVGEGNIPVKVFAETIDGKTHLIYIRKRGGYTSNFDIVVPKNMYFMMGDNRDGSQDSRYWGFVPEKNIEGKAFLIWFSIDKDHPMDHFYEMYKKIRWHRIGTRI